MGASTYRARRALMGRHTRRAYDVACWALHCRGYRAPAIADELGMDVRSVVESVRRVRTEFYLGSKIREKEVR